MRTAILKICFGVLSWAFVFAATSRAMAEVTVVDERADITWDTVSWTLSVGGEDPSSVTTEADWLSVVPADGEYGRDLEFRVQPNFSTAARQAEIFVGGRIFTLRQAGRLADESALESAAELRIDAESVVGGPAEAVTVYGDTFRPDPNFSVKVETVGGKVAVIAKTTDGGYVVGGTFSSVGGLWRRGLAKFLADGSIDPVFNNGAGFNGEVKAVVVQPDGRILVGGLFSRYGETGVPSLVRLHVDGALDTSFFPEIDVWEGTVHALALQSDGKVLVGGRYEDLGQGRFKILDRLNADGSRDATFTAGTLSGAGEVTVLALQIDGRILVGGNFGVYGTMARGGIARLSTTGAVEASFNPGLHQIENRLYAITVQPDGRILIGGAFRWEFGGVSYYTLLRLNADGGRDASFSTNHYWQSEVRAIALQADGRILTGGNIGGPWLARRNTNGSLDSSFALAGELNGMVHAVAVQSDGSVIAAGEFSQMGSQPSGGVLSVSSNGALRSTPSAVLRVPGAVAKAMPGSGGKFYVAGYFNFVNGIARDGVARLNGDGSLDSSFDPGTGFRSYALATGADKGASSMVVQSDGSVLVGGDFDRYNGALTDRLIRINADGSRDNSYGTAAGWDAVTALGSFGDGRVLMATEFDTSFFGLYFKRLTTAGNVDLTYSNSSFNSNSYVNAFAVASSGQVFAGGEFHPKQGATFVRTLVKFNSDGTMDSGFTNPSLSGTCINALHLQPDGRLLVAGDINWPTSSVHSHVGRLNADGSADPSFAVGSGFDGEVFALAAQTDGCVIAGGIFNSYDVQWRRLLARLNADGRLDTRFAAVGFVNGAPFQITFLDDGRILVAGPTAVTGNVSQCGVVLLKQSTEIVPMFTTQPQSASVNSGSAITLTAAASGTPAPTYQWFREGEPLDGQTNPSLTLSNVNSTHAGKYFVVAVNSLETFVLSDIATVTVTATQPSPPAGGGSGGGGGGALGYTYMLALIVIMLVRSFVRIGR